MLIWKLEKGLFQQSTLIQTTPVWKMNHQRMTALLRTQLENSNKKPTKTILL